MKNPQSRFAGAKLFAALLGLTLCACQLNAELSWYGNVYGSGGDAPPSPASTGWTAGSGSFYIGENSYGMIDVDNVTVGIWYGTISVGDSQYASGEVTVRAGGWLTASAMIIGNSGSGNVILEGGKMQANNLTIGKYADAQGSLVVNSGASVDVWGYSTDTTTVGYVSIGGSSDYQAGGNNGTGSLHINGGTFNLSHTASAILVGATGYGTLTVSAGTLSAATLGLGGAEFRSSLGWGHNGMIYISGGVVNVSTLSSGYKDNGATQRHTLTLAGGTLSVSQGVTFVESYSGNMYLQSGTFSAGSVLFAGENNLTVGNAMSYVRMESLHVRTQYGSGPPAFTIAVDKDHTGSPQPIISVGQLTLENGAYYIVDFSNFGEMDAAVVNLLRCDNDPDATTLSQVWEIQGIDPSRVLVQWEGNTLVAYVNSIPEPAAAAGLLGLLSLALAARRRK